MKLTADNRSRLTSQDLFRPGAVYDASRQLDGSIRLAELPGREAPILKPRRVNGRLRLPTNVPRATVAAAVRAERDER